MDRTWQVAYRWTIPLSPERINAMEIARTLASGPAARAQVNAALALSEWITAEALLAAAPADAQEPARGALLAWIQAGDVEQEVRDAQGVPLLRVRQVVGTPLEEIAPATESMRLSRFTVMRQHHHALVVEQAQGKVSFTCVDPRAAMLMARLAQGVEPSSAGELDLDASFVAALLGLLSQTGMALAIAADGSTSEEHDPVMRPLEWHDVAEHFRSRPAARMAIERARLFALQGIQEPLPISKEPMSADVIALPICDLDEVAHTDLSLTDAIEQRRSEREYGSEAITMDQLGELLFRTARFSWVSPADDRAPYEYSGRPYPAAGSCELELYVTVDRCAGLEAGFYHYDADRHALEFVRARCEATDGQLRRAAQSMGVAEPPQVLITLASRFARAGWKYQGLAYANTLRNVGVLYQTMWLVATAMDIGCCALGNGDVDAFAELTGSDPLVESTVGEICFGSHGRDRAGRGAGPLARPGAWASRDS